LTPVFRFNKVATEITFYRIYPLQFNARTHCILTNNVHGHPVWAAYEIKLGTGHIDAGAANLLKFAERVDTRKCGSPALLGVIVGTGYGYMRKDGVAVIPVGALGP
jgi:hypothetical protein